MKTLLFFTLFVFFQFTSNAQFVATMEVKEPIEGVCNQEEVYALFPSFKNQEEAVCPVSKDEILKRLNAEVQYLKENPKYSDKGMIGLVINCNGKVVKCKMDNNTKHSELDEQIEIVFNSLGEWKAGRFNDNEVDSSKLFSFVIKKGVFYWN